MTTPKITTENVQFYKKNMKKCIFGYNNSLIFIQIGKREQKKDDSEVLRP